MVVEMGGWVGGVVEMDGVVIGDVVIWVTVDMVSNLVVGKLPWHRLAKTVFES
jgi:hypothetical protein